MPNSLARRIFHSAAAFQLGAEVIEKHPIRISQGKFHMPIQPVINNILLASELYLKCLLAIEGKKAPKTHKLSELFCDAESSAQNDIATTLGYRDLQSLKSKIIALDNASVEWRYIYEQNKDLYADLQLIRGFCQATRNYIVEKHGHAIGESA